jgi:7-carboxy-7-deazaguanine synthase (Cx14CxxC type)
VTYAVKEVFGTLQGEGSNAGRAAVFVRFAGCNLWNGRDNGRAAPACAQWCDTDFVGTDGQNGGRYSAGGLVDAVLREWTAKGNPFVVLTGGEPTLQVDEELKLAMQDIRAVVAIETNGTTMTDLGWIDHVCVSPKGDTTLLRTKGQELKLIHGQPEAGANPMKWQRAAEMGDLLFDRYFLQPMEPLPGPDHDEQWAENTALAVDYVRAHPFWQLSMQTHKFLGLD